MTGKKKIVKKAESDGPEGPYETVTEGVGAIYQSMACVMRELDAIGKESKNIRQKWSFRGVDAVYNALHPILAKHQIITVPRATESMKREERATRSGGIMIYSIIKMEYDFVSGIDGSFITAGPIYGEAMDTGDKSLNKCMAVAHKYLLFQTFVIPTEMDDPDKTAHEFTDQPPAPPVQPRPEMSPAPQNQQAAPKQQPTFEPPPPASDAPVIRDAQGAAELADVVINLSNMHSGSVESLADFWHKNKREIDFLDTHWNAEYQRVKAAFTEHKQNLNLTQET